MAGNDKSDKPQIMAVVAFPSERDLSLLSSLVRLVDTYNFHLIQILVQRTLELGIGREIREPPSIDHLIKDIPLEPPTYYRESFNQILWRAKAQDLHLETKRQHDVKTLGKAHPKNDKRKFIRPCY